MTREEFIAEMRVRGWSEDDIHESLMAHDEMETERGQALSFELFLVDNPTPSGNIEFEKRAVGRMLFKRSNRSLVACYGKLQGERYGFTMAGLLELLFM